ncbi:hypothetical protein Anapl_08747 [Anas platyrhynchos]|uniref:Uncharacterized protein n=1 Tax=Anas platyrhynchos TaxID=8839 RepID=R0LF99_ANAPL|nr:hypothetical protein Anapl_08747 [Anas platyrhynchos]
MLVQNSVRYSPKLDRFTSLQIGYNAGERYVLKGTSRKAVSASLCLQDYQWIRYLETGAHETRQGINRTKKNFKEGRSHTGSYESWSGQQPIPSIVEASEYGSILSKEIPGQKISFWPAHTSYKYGHTVRL